MKEPPVEGGFFLSEPGFIRFAGLLEFIIRTGPRTTDLRYGREI